MDNLRVFLNNHWHVRTYNSYRGLLKAYTPEELRAETNALMIDSAIKTAMLAVLEEAIAGKCKVKTLYVPIGAGTGEGKAIHLRLYDESPFTDGY